MRRELWTSGPTETKRLAERLGRSVAAGDVITLSGDLGAGKTAFVQGLGRGLRVAPHAVHSPTFNIVVEHAGRLPLYHIDLYRLSSRDELVELGLETYLYGGGVTAVEWIDRFPELAPAERVAITLAIAGARQRSIVVEGFGPRGHALVMAWLGPTSDAVAEPAD